MAMKDNVGTSIIEKSSELNVRQSEIVAGVDRLTGVQRSVTPENTLSNTTHLIRPAENPAAQSTSTDQLLPVSKAVLARRHIVAGDKGNPVADQFDILRTKILREMKANGWRTLGITSPMPHCGKTTVAINLCVSIAKGIHKDIVLVDLDLRNPRIGSYLDINSSPDLSDVLEGRVRFQEPLVNPGIPRLLIIPNNKAYLHSSEMLTSREAILLAENLCSMEDVQLVVFDLPPVLPTDDTLAFLPHVDCLLVVIADGVSTKQELEKTRQLLQHSNVLGYVLNQV